jgi:hypothetical protein
MLCGKYIGVMGGSYTQATGNSSMDTGHGELLIDQHDCVNQVAY